MEASALKPHIRVSGGGRSRTPLLRMQSDERLVTLVRRGNTAAFGVLVSRYESRLLAFCRHLLRSREDAEDVLQEVFASAFKAMMGDERPIRVRPWLYRIARNRCLNHLRRISAIGVDSIEDHFTEHGPSTSDTVQRREDLRLLVGDIQDLPESQRSALLLREMEALSYEQIADVMDKTIPSVKSLLIRARRSLAESAEARSLSCEEAQAEFDEVQAGLRERPSRVVRRHMCSCARCAQLRQPEPSITGVRLWLPLAPLFLLKKLSFSPLFHSAPAGSTATATATAAGAGAAAAPSLVVGSTAAGFISAGIGGLAGKAAVGLTAAALGVAGAVVVDTSVRTSAKHGSAQSARVVLADATDAAGLAGARVPAPTAYAVAAGAPVARPKRAPAPTATQPDRAPASTGDATTTSAVKSRAKGRPGPAAAAAAEGRTQTQAVTTTLPGNPTQVTDATDDPALPAGPPNPPGSGGEPPTATPPAGTTPPVSSPGAVSSPGGGTTTTAGTPGTPGTPTSSTPGDPAPPGAPTGPTTSPIPGVSTVPGATTGAAFPEAGTAAAPGTP